MFKQANELKQRIMEITDLPDVNLSEIECYRAGLRDAYEKAAKAACEWCREGNFPVVFDEMSTQWAHIRGNGATRCKATFIRDLMEQECGKAVRR